MKEGMTIRDIAGFCPEEAVWKMMADVSGLLVKEDVGCMLTPDSVVIDGYTFMVEDGCEPIKEFMAPEQNAKQKSDANEQIWSLGAVAYYLATGHVVFGGHGGSYQKEHPSVALPILPKGFQDLTPVLQKCLCYAPEMRIKVKELHDLSQKGLASCKQQVRRKSVCASKGTISEIRQSSEKWPEQMIEV